LSNENKTSLWHTLPDSFNRFAWMSFVNDVTKSFELEHGIKLDVIIPWGFEVFNNEAYLYKRLRRFYCYFGIEPNLKIDKEKLAYELGMSIINKLKKTDERFYRQVVACLAGETPFLLREPNYMCQFDDCVIVAVVKNSDNIMRDYARYILGTLDGIAKGVGEISDYMNYLIPRWRLFQLYLMHEELFGYLLTKMSKDQQNLKDKCVSNASNHIWPFYNFPASNVPASFLEQKIINDLILPRIFEIKQVIIADKSEIIEDKIESFHSEQSLNIYISKERYGSVIEKIILTYNKLGLIGKI
jgi:hypothetical protein